MHGIINDMKKRGIKWVFICGVDNILLKFLDPLFLGISIHKNSQVSSKTMFKEDPLSPEYVFGRLNGKPTILDYKLVSESLTHEVDDEGNFLYRELNVLSHLFTIEAIEKASTLNLPYHRAYKKNTFINDEGMKQVPENKNSFKFETFIFDAFNYFDDLLLFRVSKDEFAPIKDAVRCE
jgi:UDP-N-acetylglucosamine/UDP-N-acetylgalactosamine diphosphorylase